MKNYAIIIGENNEELSRKVQEALLEAGFVGSITCDAKVIGAGAGRFWLAGEKSFESFARQGAEFLYPSYVIEHAAELDGVKPKVKEVTMQDLEEKYGCKVKVVK